MTGAKPTADNIYGDPSLADQDWHVRHDDEIWTDQDRYVASCANAPDAHRIVSLHNGQRRRNREAGPKVDKAS
jgi:hypothetical protein